jgi:SAM-dependent methyltransferase
VHNHVSKFSNEIELRKQQWKETLDTNPEWILTLDADEIFDGDLRTLDLNDPKVNAYYFRLFDMWDEHHYRDDKFWSAHTTYRPFLVRHDPKLEYVWKETAQHCGRFPSTISSLSHQPSVIRLKHLGWAKEHDRKAKYDRYMKLDPNGTFGWKEQYESILDPAPNLVPFDVVQSSEVQLPMFDYKKYWEDTYSSNGTSGAGSYGLLAQFKADVVNDFGASCDRVTEFGCGDGNQLRLMKYRNYLGLDVSPTAVARCAKLFKGDESKRFEVYNPSTFGGTLADFVVCLDVLYHITDDTDFEKTLSDMFACNPSRIALYTRLPGVESSTVETIFDRDIFEHLKRFEDRIVSTEIVKQKYPELSSADFILLQVKP